MMQSSKPRTMPFARAAPDSLLNRNATWSEDFVAQQPELASALSQGQHPKVFWIGCSDSRVPESVVCNARPGELFVLRNVANQFHPHDDSAVSALTYAVQALGVEHVIVVGHTGCGGVSAAVQQVLKEQSGKLELPSASALNRHLSTLTDLARYVRAKMEERQGLDDAAVHERMVQLVTEASVRHQLQTIMDHPVIQDNWKEKVSPLSGRVNPRVTLHGWIHDIRTGRLMDLNLDVPPPETNGEGA